MLITQEQFKRMGALEMDDLPFFNLTDWEKYRIFINSPTTIQTLGIRWGLNDTVFKDEMFVWIIRNQFNINVHEYYNNPEFFDKMMVDDGVAFDFEKLEKDRKVKEEHPDNVVNLSLNFKDKSFHGVPAESCLITIARGKQNEVMTDCIWIPYNSESWKNYGIVIEDDTDYLGVAYPVSTNLDACIHVWMNDERGFRFYRVIKDKVFINEPTNVTVNCPYMGEIYDYHRNTCSCSEERQDRCAAEI